MENDCENRPTKKAKGVWVKNKFEVCEENEEPYRKCMGEYCEAKYSMTTSFNNLKIHWNKHHLDDMVSKSADRIQFHDQVWNHKLMLYVIKTKRPYSMVEDRYFRDFCCSMDANKKILSRRELSDKLITNCDELLPHVIKKLDEQISISLTFDIWTAQNSSRSFITVTGHFIDENWKLVSCVLEFGRLEYPHDTRTISRFLITTINRFNIQDKVITITADNASTNTSSIEVVHEELKLGNKFGFDDVQVRCIAHILNLAVKSALVVLDEELETIRAVVKKISSSTKQSELFEKIQEKLISEARSNKIDLPFKKVYRLVNEMDTRWNSTFNMLERFLMLQKAIEIALGKMIVLKNSNYNINWKLVQKLICYLGPSYDLTVRLSGQSYSTVSLTSSLIPILMKHTLGYLTDEHLSEAAKAFYAKLDDYSNSIKNDIAIVSTCLDPRIKLSFITAECQDTAINKVRYYIAKVCTDDLDRSGSFQSQAETSIYDQAYISVGGDEVDQYFANPREIKERNVIDFWKAANSAYPRMQKLARILLCVQATSVASERAFSIAGLIDHPRRACLADESFRASVLVDSWHHLVNEP